MLDSLLNALFPAQCPVCGSVLVAGERCLCYSCLSDLPLTGYSATAGNPAERRLAALPLEAATSMCLFEKEGTARYAVHAMKFHSNAELCVHMGRLMGQGLMRSGRFDGVDCLVPVPLHWMRRLARGYNQSLLLCRGMADVLGRDIVADALVRHRRTAKQSLQLAQDRFSNVEGAFRVRRPERLEGRHILLVDDVLTTGATLAACCDALAGIPGLKISVATFSIAG